LLAEGVDEAEDGLCCARNLLVFEVKMDVQCNHKLFQNPNGVLVVLLLFL